MLTTTPNKVFFHCLSSACLQNIISTWLGTFGNAIFLTRKDFEWGVCFFGKNSFLQPLFESDGKCEELFQKWENQDKHHSIRDAGMTFLVLLMSKMKMFKESTNESITMSITWYSDLVLFCDINTHTCLFPMHRLEGFANWKLVRQKSIVSLSKLN